MEVATVAEVIGVATKKDGTKIQGTKNGKDWAMYSIILDDGRKLNVFGPVKVGDTVYGLTQDEKYHSWSGKVKQAGSSVAPTATGQPTNAQILKAVLDTQTLIKKLLQSPIQSNAVLEQADVLPNDDEVTGEPIDLSDIPF